MTVTIPRAEIDAVMERYDPSWVGGNDVPVDVVRDAVSAYRKKADAIWGTKFEEVSHRLLLKKAADDLDALADQYERGAP
jgi:hypothetical protein